MGEVKRALQSLETVEVDLGEHTGLLLADDLESELPPDPWVALLPALDVSPMALRPARLVSRLTCTRAVRPFRQHRAVGVV